MVLVAKNLWKFVSQEIQAPSNATQAAEHTIKYIKVRAIVLDGMKNHIIPRITNNKLPYTRTQMYEYPTYDMMIPWNMTHMIRYIYILKNE